MSQGSPNVTGSPGLEGGATPCASLAGPMANPCGPDPALASLSARQAGELGLLTSGTYGPRGSGSSRSANLRSCLVSRLKRRLDTGGSTLFKLTWKEKVTPSGQLVCLLRASGRRESGSGCGSWATPAARDYRSESATDEFNAKRWGHKRGKPLSAEATLASWPTPTALSPATENYNEAGDSCNLRKTRLLVSGPTATGSPVKTESSGQLNPTHSRWLMGYPPVWDACAGTAMPSSPKSRRRSSPRTGKRG